MLKWDSEIFRNNHLRLMKIHIGFAIFYFTIDALLLYSATLGHNAEQRPSILINAFALSLLVLIHGLLAYGSYNKIEISRKMSEWGFALICLFFIPPIGTLLSIYFLLPAAQWKNTKEEP